MRARVAIAFALLALYAPTYWDMAHGPWRTDEQAHAPIIALLAAWLFWRGSDVLRTPGRPASTLGSFILATGLVAYAGGRGLEIPLLEIGSQIPVFAGLLLILGGVPWLRALGFPLGFLGFMLPLPGVLVDALTRPMKEWISVCAEELLYLAGYPIARSGIMLSLSQYRLLVADTCSGLHSLIFLGALGLLFIHLAARQSRMHATLLLVSILPVAFAANLFRVLVILLTTYHFGDGIGQGLLHSLAGMMVFVLALLFLFALDAMLTRTFPPPAASPVRQRISGGAPATTHRNSRWGAAWLCLPLLVTAGAAMQLHPGERAADQKPQINLQIMIPSQFAGWRLEASAAEVAMDTTPGTTTPYNQSVARTYVNAERHRVMLAIAYGERQLGDGLQAHRPEYCYRAQGFVVSSVEDGQLEMPGGTLPLRRLQTRRPGRSEPVSYWMTVGNQPTLPGLGRKLTQARHALSGRVADGMLVRVSSIDDSAVAAYAVHNRFIIDLLSALAEPERIRLAGTAHAKQVE